jgi:hypothetical protein
VSISASVPGDTKASAGGEAEAYPGRLHRHALNPAPTEPTGKVMQVAGEAAEPAQAFCYRCGMVRGTTSARSIRFRVRIPIDSRHLLPMAFGFTLGSALL